MRLGVQCALVRGALHPGFVDLQGNGFAGVDLMRAGPEEWAHAGAAPLATAWRAARGRFALVSDAGMGDGVFTLGGSVVRSSGG